MPVLITVGRSTKLSENYNSRGYSVTIQAELPAGAVEDPNLMAETTNQLFQLAADLLDEQIGHGATDSSSNRPTPAPAEGRHAAPSAVRPASRRTAPVSVNGQGSTRPKGEQRGITQAQAKALANMARRVGQDPEQLALDEYGKGTRELSIREASSLIDSLKGRIEQAMADSR